MGGLAEERSGSEDQAALERSRALKAAASLAIAPPAIPQSDTTDGSVATDPRASLRRLDSVGQGRGEGQGGGVGAPSLQPLDSLATPQSTLARWRGVQRFVPSATAAAAIADASLAPQRGNPSRAYALARLSRSWALKAAMRRRAARASRLSARKPTRRRPSSGLAAPSLTRERATVAIACGSSPEMQPRCAEMRRDAPGCAEMRRDSPAAQAPTRGRTRPRRAQLSRRRARACGVDSAS